LLTLCNDFYNGETQLSPGSANNRRFPTSDYNKISSRW